MYVEELPLAYSYQLGEPRLLLLSLSCGLNTERDPQGTTVCHQASSPASGTDRIFTVSMVLKLGSLKEESELVTFMKSLVKVFIEGVLLGERERGKQGRAG